MGEANFPIMRRGMEKALREKQYKVRHLGKFYPPPMGGMEVYLQQLVFGQSKMMEVAALTDNDLLGKGAECLCRGKHHDSRICIRTEYQTMQSVL
jgi:hypothetical protein